MAQYGIQWDRNALEGKGEVKWVKCSQLKFLLKQNEDYYTVKQDFYDIKSKNFQPIKNETATIEDKFEQCGFDNINDILKATNTIKQNGIKKDIDEGNLLELDLSDEIKNIDIE